MRIGDAVGEGVDQRVASAAQRLHGGIGVVDDIAVVAVRADRQYAVGPGDCGATARQRRRDGSAGAAGAGGIDARGGAPRVVGQHVTRRMATRRAVVQPPLLDGDAGVRQRAGRRVVIQEVVEGRVDRITAGAVVATGGELRRVHDQQVSRLARISGADDAVRTGGVEIEAVGDAVGLELAADDAVDGLIHAACVLVLQAAGDVVAGVVRVTGVGRHELEAGAGEGRQHGNVVQRTGLLAQRRGRAGVGLRECHRCVLDCIGDAVERHMGAVVLSRNTLLLRRAQALARHGDRKGFTFIAWRVGGAVESRVDAVPDLLDEDARDAGAVRATRQPVRVQQDDRSPVRAAGGKRAKRTMQFGLAAQLHFNRRAVAADIA
ncbi:hypothetical protein [Roseateles sp. BYS96W]|uniref:Uncharacterized protein n=1 Tax=Pelomonas nitida TaxID=3299027 RepID=A0ABW7G1K7_9BURK